MADIFISYKREDYSLAQSVAEKLIATGWTVWWDRNIPVGKAYDKVIEEEMAAAKCIITLWTKDSVNSLNVKEEAQEGLRRNILIPVSVGGVHPPYGFKMIQTLAWKDEGVADEASLEKLIEQIPRLVEPGEVIHQNDPDDDDPIIPEPEPEIKETKEDKPTKEKITGTLKFTRENRYSGMLITMSIYVDDSMVGKVGNDQSLDFALPAGQHYLQVKGGLAFSTGKELFIVKPGETQHWMAEFTLWNTIKLKRV